MEPAVQRTICEEASFRRTAGNFIPLLKANSNSILPNLFLSLALLNREFASSFSFI